MAWNSDNHGIKETVKQNNHTGKVADGEKLQQGGGPCRPGWLNGKLRNESTRLRADCGLWQLPQFLPVRQEFFGKCAREEQVSCIVPSPAPPPQAAPQCSKKGCPAQVNT